MKLPHLHQSDIDDTLVGVLFDDLSRCAEILSVVPKARLQTYVEERAITLSAARAGLRSGDFRAVQIRYRFEGREWCDTLMARPGGGARVVRICTDEALAPAQPGPA